DVLDEKQQQSAREHRRREERDDNRSRRGARDGGGRGGAVVEGVLQRGRAAGGGSLDAHECPRLCKRDTQGASRVGPKAKAQKAGAWKPAHAGRRARLQTRNGGDGFGSRFAAAAAN